MLRHAAAWCLWWIALFWLWLLLAGDWNRIEWIGAACTATVAATIVERMRTCGPGRLHVPLDRIRSSVTVPPMIVADFGVVMWVLARSLVRRRAVEGELVRRDFDAGAKTTPQGFARRAWTTLLAGYSPNAYVIDIDAEADTVLLHDLVRWRRSEEPA